jgi:hypothetical protein
MAKGKYFHIKSKSSGLYLDVKGGSRSPGTPVIVWSKNNGDNQIWYHHAATRTIRSKQSDLCLDVQGDRLVINPYQQGKGDQTWAYNKNRGVIENLSNPNRVLDIVGDNKAPGTEVCAWNHHGKDNQKWELESAGSPRYFYIRTFLCDKVLDISGNQRSPGGNVILYKKKSGGSADNQLWFEDTFGNIRSKLNDKLVLDASGGDLKTAEYREGGNKLFWAIDGTKIINVQNPQEVLDVKGGASADGTAICAWTWKAGGNNNQQWHFDYV